MNNKEAIKWLNKNRPCISMTCNKENADKINIATDMAIKALGERPQGKWIIIDDCEQFIAKCSVCGRIIDSRMAKDYPSCPYCLADMRGDRK